MNILLYRDDPTGNPEWLTQLAAKLSEVAVFEIVRKRDELVAQLRCPSAEIGIVVLQIASHDELHDFVASKDLFAGRQVVVILPDATSETLSLGHRLHPRYVMTPGNPMEWLEAIVLRMVKRRRTGT